MIAKRDTITIDDSKPMLSFWQIWNMSFGFLGIQYAFGLQQAYMSPIYRYLGVEEANIPLLLLASPMTGLIVQPIVGALSDRTWTRLGRRRPYFLVGAIIASICLIFMPYSSSIWMAAGLLWILDSAANTSMEPFRAFIADKLPEKQRSLGFAVQTFFIGSGIILAAAMPYILPWLGFDVSEEVSELQRIPDYVKFPFLIGAVVLLGAVIWTIIKTPEYPPADIDAFKKANKNKNAFLNAFVEIYKAAKNMPKTMKQLWWVKFFTWFGLPIMWSYLGLAIARHCFDAPTPEYDGFSEGVKMGGIGLVMMNFGLISTVFLLPSLAKKIGRRLTHAICLFIGGVGFISMLFSGNVTLWMVAMVLVGIAWASIMTMPYVMLSSTVPKEKMGVYMGLFNTFIVIPYMLNSLTMKWIYPGLLNNDARNAIVLAGVLFFVAAASNFFIGNEAEFQIDTKNE